MGEGPPYLDAKVVIDGLIVSVSQKLDIAFPENLRRVLGQVQSPRDREPVFGREPPLREPLVPALRLPCEGCCKLREKVRVDSIHIDDRRELVSSRRSLVDEVLQIGPE